MLNIEVIQRVQSLYSRGAKSDDSRLSNRHIFNKLVSVRAKLLAQDSKRKQKINQWNYQTLPCVEMIIAPIAECPCIPTADCVILKSKYPIPRMLTDMVRHLVQSVSTLDGKVIFDETTFQDMKNQKGNKYTSTVDRYFFREGHLFLTHGKELEVITMTALFADPIEVSNFINFCPSTVNNCTSPLDMEFPIDPELVDTVVQLSAQELAIMFSQMIEDKTNNGGDDSGMRQRPARR